MPHSVAYLMGGTFDLPGWTPPVSQHVALVNPVLIDHDTAYGGTGRINGTVLIDGTPDQPTHRRTQLIRDRDGVAIAEQWSNAADGVYLFENIDMAERYTVVAFDHLGVFLAVIADNLTPEAM